MHPTTLLDPRIVCCSDWLCILVPAAHRNLIR